MKDTIYRQEAIDAIVNCTNCGDEKTLRAYVAKHNLDNGWTGGILEAIDAIEDLPSAEPEVKPIEYRDCANAMLRMWMDNVVTDEEYNRIMDKLNAHWGMKNG